MPAFRIASIRSACSRFRVAAAALTLLVPLLAVPEIMATKAAAAMTPVMVPAVPAGTAPVPGAAALQPGSVLTGTGYLATTSSVPAGTIPEPSLSGTSVGGISSGEQPSAGAEQVAAQEPAKRRGGIHPDTVGTPPAFQSPAWTVAEPASLPVGLVYASMVFDAANNTDVLFGGATSSGLSSNTYVWDGTTWTLESPANHPSARDNAYMAYDAASGQQDVMLFGGYNGRADLNDTWTWDGTNWTVHTGTAPSVRSMGAAAFLPATGSVILFGTDNSTADTWSWNGSWTQLSPAASPPGRAGESLVDDPNTGDLLMFGGIDGSTFLNDTWTFNGTTWTQLSPADAPPAEAGAAIAYDPTLQRIIMVGGQGPSAAIYGGVYAWDESDWRTAAMPTAISARAWSVLAQSPANGQLVAFGGTSGSNYLDDTQTFDWAELGAQPSYHLIKFKLDDQETASVNPANGNLVVTANDYTVQSVGSPFTVGRTFNSQERELDPNGDNWYFNGAQDAFIANGLGTSDVYAVGLQGGGTEQDFRYNTATNRYCNEAADVFCPPAGMDADLANSSGTYTLTQHQSRAVTTLGPSSGYYEGSLVDNNGHGISYTYSSGVLTGASDAEARTYTYTPTTGEPTKITDNASGNYVQYGYSGTQMTSFTDADLNPATQYGYNSSGQLTSITTPQGRELTIGYDAYDRVNQIVQVTNTGTGAGYTTSFSYQPAASGDNTVGGIMRTLMTQPNQQGGGLSWTFVSNHAAEVVNTINPNGQTLNGSAYDNDAQPSSITDALSAVTTLGHDSLENLNAITSPTQSGGGAGRESTLTYPTPTEPAAGAYYPSGDYQATKTYDAQSNETDYGYDTNGNLDTTTDSLPSQTTITNHYDGDGGTTCTNAKTGELCSTVDARGNTTSFTYHTQGDLESITPPLPLTTTYYTFTTDSQVSTVADPRSITTSYFYDADGRTSEVRNDGGTSATCSPTDAAADKCVQYTYDDDGNLITRLDVTGTTHYAYDTVGRITTETFPSTATSGLGYDASSNVTSYADAGGTVTYYYNASNKLTKMAEPGGSCPTTPTYPNTYLCTGFVNNANDFRTQINYPNGEVVTVTPDSSGRVTAISSVLGSTSIASLTYDYDNGTGGTTDTGLVQSSTDNGTATSYGYDALNRLHTATTGSTVDTYNYDGAGNQTSSSVTGGTTMNYSVDNANQLCYWTTGTATDGTTACPTTPGGAHGYSYDADGNQTTAGVTSVFSYSNFNQLASDTMSGSTSTYTYADIGSSNLTVSGNTTLLNGLLGTTASTTTAGTTYFTRDPSDTLISMRTSAGSSYYTLDRQGSVVALTNSTPTNTALYSYGPYGAVTESGSQDTVNPYLYAGGYKDPTSGLLKFGQRYYNPGLADWTQQDPLDQINNVSQANRYTYAGDDPINNSDPIGTDAFSDFFTKSVPNFFSSQQVENDIYNVASVAEDAAGCVGGASAFGAIGFVAGGAVSGPFAVVGGAVGAVAGCAVGVGFANSSANPGLA